LVVTWQPELDEVRRRRELAERMGGPDKVGRQHEAGRLTVRERLTALLDDGSFHEIGTLAGMTVYDSGGELADFTPANFVTGTGRIEGRKVVVGGDDFTIRGGAADAAIAGKQIYAEQLANQMRLPLVRLVEGTGGGGSVKMLERMGHTYVPVNPGWDYVVDNLSTVPVVAAGLGPVAGLGAARLCAAHLSVLSKASRSCSSPGRRWCAAEREKTSPRNSWAARPCTAVMPPWIWSRPRSTRRSG
jgi:acetyl-CoA carboxylase carboxyltransferase component